MKWLLLIFALLAASGLMGCATKMEKLATTRIDVVHGTNRVSLVNPKDTEFDEAEIPTPHGIARIRGYRSSANQDAVNAARIQAQAQTAAFENFGNKVVDKLEKMVDRGATAYGFPKPPVTVPATVVLTNAPPK